MPSGKAIITGVIITTISLIVYEKFIKNSGLV